MRVKRLAQEHNTVTRPGLEPGPVDPESGALTISLPRLLLTAYMVQNPPYWLAKESSNPQNKAISTVRA